MFHSEVVKVVGDNQGACPYCGTKMRRRPDLIGWGGLWLSDEQVIECPNVECGYTVTREPAKSGEK